MTIRTGMLAKNYNASTLYTTVSMPTTAEDFKPSISFQVILYAVPSDKAAWYGTVDSKAQTITTTFDDLIEDSAEKSAKEMVADGVIGRKK